MVLLYLTSDSWKQANYEEVSSSNYGMQTLETLSHFFCVTAHCSEEKPSVVRWAQNVTHFYFILHYYQMYAYCIFQYLLAFHLAQNASTDKQPLYITNIL